MEEAYNSSENLNGFETEDPRTIFTICFISAFNFFVGIPTHFYVLLLIFKGTKGVAPEFFVLNLSICEIGICLSALFIFTSYWCLICGILAKFLLGLSVTGRPLFQSLMCVERYVAAVHPVTFLKCKPLKYRVFCCLVSWIFSLGSCVVYMELSTYYAMAQTTYFSSQFVIFLCIQFSCLVGVLRVLKQTGPGERKSEKENQMKRRAFHLILIITSSMAITYLPYTVSGLTVIFAQRTITTLWLVSMACYVLAGFVQPILFLGRVGKLPRICSKSNKVT